MHRQRQTDRERHRQTEHKHTITETHIILRHIHRDLVRQTEKDIDKDNEHTHAHAHIHTRRRSSSSQPRKPEVIPFCRANPCWPFKQCFIAARSFCPQLPTSSVWLKDAHVLQPSNSSNLKHIWDPNTYHQNNEGHWHLTSEQVLCLTAVFNL